MGRQAAFSGIGGIAFLVGGGLLADLSWRAPFAIYLLALPVLVLAWRFLPEPARAAPASPTGRTGFPALRAPVVLLAALGFASMVVFYLTPVQVPFHLEGLGAPSGALAGAAVAATTLTGAVASALYGRLRSRIGRRTTFALLFATMAAGYAAVSLAGSASGVIAGLALFGCGFGLLIPSLNSLAGDLAEPATRGAVVGALTTSLFLGQFASPLAAGPLIATVGSAGAFGVGAGLLAALGVGFALARARDAVRTPASPRTVDSPVRPEETR